MATKAVVKLLPLPEAADRLGLKVNALRSWIYRREIDFVKVGRAVRIPETVIDGIIEDGTVPARKPRR